MLAGESILDCRFRIIAFNFVKNKYRIMSNLVMQIPHKLSQEEALSRIQKVLQSVQTRFAGQIKDLHQEWNGNTGEFSFSAMNMPVSGTLTVNGQNVELDGKIPLAASMFQGKIKSVIMEEAGKILA
jgi:hypothetical protein